MSTLDKNYMDDLEQQIKNGITRMGAVCKDPLMITMMPDYSHQLMAKFVEFADAARLLQNTPKDNVTL